MNELSIGDKVTTEGNEYSSWVGEVVKFENDTATDVGMCLVKWDPSYALSEGLWTFKSVLAKVDNNLKPGKQT